MFLVFPECSGKKYAQQQRKRERIMFTAVLTMDDYLSFLVVVIVFFSHCIILPFPPFLLHTLTHTHTHTNSLGMCWKIKVINWVITIILWAKMQLWNFDVERGCAKCYYKSYSLFFHHWIENSERERAKEKQQKPKLHRREKPPTLTT